MSKVVEIKTNEEIIITKLDDLEKNAQDAAVDLNKASGKNAILDKAFKALKPGLTDLDKVHQDALKEDKTNRISNLISDLEGSYEGAAAVSIEEVWDTVDTEIQNLKNEIEAIETVEDTEGSLRKCRNDVVAAQKAVDQRSAKFDKAQNDLQGLSKQILEMQKAIATLETEVKDAHSKHQLVEAVVKLKDLKKMNQDFQKLIQIDKETNSWPAETNRWKDLNEAAKDLIDMTNNLILAQSNLLSLETKYNKLKVDYEKAQKNRLDDIKKQVADREPIKN
jgi:hypothetical protein